MVLEIIYLIWSVTCRCIAPIPRTKWAGLRSGLWRPCAQCISKINMLSISSSLKVNLARCLFMPLIHLDRSGDRLLSRLADNFMVGLAQIAA